MADDKGTLEEQIQLLVDGRLDDGPRRALEDRIADDPEAKRQLEAMRWLKSTARRALRDSAPEPPGHLLDRINDALDREDAQRTGKTAATLRWLAAAAVIVLAVALALVIGNRERPIEIPLAVASAVHHYDEGQLVLDFRSSDGQEIEAFFVEQGIEFPTRVFDLAMMDFHLVGGSRHVLRRTPSAAFAYRGPDGVRILCQMYRGRIEDLPQTDDVRKHNGITFYSYKLNCVSMTFWREGDVICVLASMADLEQVVSLAFAKAMKS